MLEECYLQLLVIEDSMKDFRFFFVVATGVPFSLWAIQKANYMIKHREKYSRQQCFDFAVRIIDHMRRRSRTVTEVYGRENLPAEDGFAIYSNHQGKYDALGILLAVKRPCSVLWEARRADRLLARQIVGLLETVTIDLDNMRDKVRAIQDVTKEIREGRNYLIFPEGGYCGNKNQLQEFQGGCFSCSQRSKTPMVPVAIYDSYKAMNGNSLKKATTQIHFLPPVLYEEYKDLSKKEMAQLVKERIAERIREIEDGVVFTDSKEVLG